MADTIPLAEAKSLIARAKAGDSGALEYLYRAYEAGVYTLARRLTKTAEEVAATDGEVGTGSRGSERLDRVRRMQGERAVRPVLVVCAGINRHGEGDERALHRRSSDPRWPRVMRWRS